MFILKTFNLDHYYLSEKNEIADVLMEFKKKKVLKLLFFYILATKKTEVYGKQ